MKALLTKITAVSAAIPVFLCGISLAGGAGSSSLYSMTQPPSARSSALSGACTALSGSLSLMQYNPASLLGIPGFSISTSYQAIGTREYHTTAMAGFGFENSAVGVGIKYYDTGTISIYDSYGYEVSGRGQRDMIFMLGSAQDFEFITAGLNLKMFFSEIFGESAFGFAGDAGCLFPLSQGLDAGFSIQNFGTPAKYIERKESLPLIIRGALAYSSSLGENDYTVSLDLPYYVNENHFFIKTGVEFQVHELLTLMAGGVLTPGSGNDTDRKLSAGWSFGSESLRIVYSVNLASDLDSPQHVSTELRF